jgi:DNA gyrase subunit A
LFKYTALQSTFGVQMLALVDGEPRLLSLKRALHIHVLHRIDVLTRRTQFELARAKHRAHILEGLKIALDHIDAIISTIRESPDAETARVRMMDRFGLTEIQAQAILDMQLRRLAALERKKIDDEYLELIQRISYLEDLLASPRKILYLVRDELAELKQTYGDGRRTRITLGEAEIDEEDLIAEEVVLVAITQRGYVKRVPVDTYRAQGRGGRGVIGMTTGDQDDVSLLFQAHSLDAILFFSNQGKVYLERAYQIPEATRTAKGALLAGILALDADERITAAMAVSGFEASSHLLMATAQGRGKRISLDEFRNVRPSGIIAINLDDGDELGWVLRVQDGSDRSADLPDAFVVTENGQALRFNVRSVRRMGRTAAGVNLIRLGKGDCLVGVCLAAEGSDLLTLTTKGYGKRTPVSEFSTRSRYTKGIRCASRDTRVTGKLAAARTVTDDDEIIVISNDGMVLRTRVDDIPRQGRAARGSKVFGLRPGDLTTSVAVLEAEKQQPEVKDSEARAALADMPAELEDPDAGLADPDTSPAATEEM